MRALHAVMHTRAQQVILCNTKLCKNTH